QPRQAVRRDGGHRARLVPPEELHDLLSHPPELLLAAGPDLPQRSLNAESVDRTHAAISPPSLPGLTRQSRLGMHRAHLSGMPGSRPGMTWREGANSRE